MDIKPTREFFPVELDDTLWTASNCVTTFSDLKYLSPDTLEHFYVRMWQCYLESCVAAYAQSLATFIKTCEQPKPLLAAIARRWEERPAALAEVLINAIQ